MNIDASDVNGCNGDSFDGHCVLKGDCMLKGYDRRWNKNSVSRFIIRSTKTILLEIETESGVNRLNRISKRRNTCIHIDSVGSRCNRTLYKYSNLVNVSNLYGWLHNLELTVIQ